MWRKGFLFDEMRVFVEERFEVDELVLFEKRRI